jgi:hypothetical protein
MIASSIAESVGGALQRDLLVRGVAAAVREAAAERGVQLD